MNISALAPLVLQGCHLHISKGIDLGIVLLLTLIMHSAQAQSVSLQTDIDDAYTLILSTPLGRSICKNILGADPAAIAFNLGVSKEKSRDLANRCGRATASPMIYPTSPSDIRKLTLKNFDPRTYGYSGRSYKFVKSDRDFPIESWTDPFTNTTFILSPELPVDQSKLVEIIAHEMAVYFDSKANPSHPDALSIPELRELNDVNRLNTMNPLIAAADPLIGHTLTYVRALQVEVQILDPLIKSGKIKAPADYSDKYLTYLRSKRCTENCLESLILRMRGTYLPIALPLIAFSPYFRSSMLSELQRIGIQPGWARGEWTVAQQVLNQTPVEYLKTQFSGDPLNDIKRVFDAQASSPADVQQVSTFLNDQLWPLERQALVSALTPSGQPLLEYLKTPLLSGYNVALSSGPRVRIRTGNIE